MAFRSALKPHFLHLASWKARNKLDLSAENIRPQTTNRASKPKPKTPAKSHVHGKQAKAGHGYLAQSNPPFPSPPPTARLLKHAVMPASHSEKIRTKREQRDEIKIEWLANNKLGLPVTMLVSNENPFFFCIHLIKLKFILVTLENISIFSVCINLKGNWCRLCLFYIIQNLPSHPLYESNSEPIPACI